MEALIAVGCTIVGLLFGMMTYGKNRDKDIRADATRTAVIETKLDNISKGVNDIIADFKETKKEMETFSKGLTEVTASDKSAHLRIDDLKKGVNRNEN